ncbi:hypothetical protein ScPMuIL_018649 [Solemya velum]
MQWSTVTRWYNKSGGSPRPATGRFFLRNDLFHGSCMTQIFTKFLGYSLIGTVTICQLPQIVKILRVRNASGVSFLGMILRLVASSSTVAFAVWKGYPISTWGENLFFMIQNVILVCLLLNYNKRPVAALSFMIIFFIFMLLVIWPIVPTSVLNFLHVISMPSLIISRILQIYRNHRNHGTGQLSATSSFLGIFQSFGRLTTSIVVIQDWVFILTFAQVSLLNLYLTLQVLYYRKTKKEKKS